MQGVDRPLVVVISDVDDAAVVRVNCNRDIAARALLA
jgi:hypothetical protein